MREKLRKILLFLFGKLPFRVIQRLAKQNLTVVTYHTILNKPLPHIQNLYQLRNVEMFENDLDLLLKFYKPVTLSEVVNFLNNGKILPKNALLITFDDGFREVKEVAAEILLQKKIPAAFFLNTAFIDNKNLFFRNKISLLLEYFRQPDNYEKNEIALKYLQNANIEGNTLNEKLLNLKYHQTELINNLASETGYNFAEFLENKKPYMTSNEIQYLIDKGFEIGAHSIDHPRFSEITEEEQYHQIVESINFLQQTFKIPHRTFAFPFSDDGLDENFFNKIFSEYKIDVIFALKGLIEDFSPRIIQRLWAEANNDNMRKILVENIYNRLSRKIKNTNKVNRRK